MNWRKVAAWWGEALVLVLASAAVWCCCWLALAVD